MLADKLVMTVLSPTARSCVRDVNPYEDMTIWASCPTCGTVGAYVSYIYSFLDSSNISLWDPFTLNIQQHMTQSDLWSYAEAVQDSP